MDSINLFVPGRVCLFGEHSDWAGAMRKFNADIVPGQALVVCTEEGIYAAASPSDRLKIRSYDKDGNIISGEYEMSLRVLQKVAAEAGFFSYVAGVAAYMLNYYHIGGLELSCTEMTLPQKKGLSSSAAICTLTAQAFNRIYGLNLTIRGEMEAAYGGELLTSSRCGRLDQAVAYGHGVVNMCFDGDRMDVERVKVGAPLHIVYADLKSKKDTMAILADLNNAYPYPKNDNEKKLHRLLGETNGRIVTEARRAMGKGDAGRIGQLMTEAQEHFDKYAAPLSPVELEAPVLHSVLADVQIAQWTYGGKGVGSQGDGSVQFIAKNAESVAALKEYLRHDLGLDAFSVTIPKSHAIRKAVVPLGGYGTRMYPATKIVNKEFLPVIDTDGIAKPSLLILLESLLNNDIEEICLIVRPGEEVRYRSLFTPAPERYLRKLPKEFKDYDEKIAQIQDRLTFVVQEEALGFGHAVLQSKMFADDEPVLVLLGDHLFKSNSGQSCLSQLTSAYEEREELIIGLFDIHESDVTKYGVALIKDDAMHLAGLVEKPSVERAKAECLYNGRYNGVFMYVITQMVYSELQKEFERWNEANGELQLTTVLDSVIRKFGASGVIIDGTHFDLGLPDEYMRTINDYAKRG